MMEFGSTPSLDAPPVSALRDRAGLAKNFGFEYLVRCQPLPIFCQALAPNPGGRLVFQAAAVRLRRYPTDTPERLGDNFTSG